MRGKDISLGVTYETARNNKSVPLCVPHTNEHPRHIYIFPLNALYENRISKATKRTSRDRAEKERGMRARVHPSKAEALSLAPSYLGCKCVVLLFPSSSTP